MNRRAFLKLVGTIPLALALPPAVRRALGAGAGTRQNVIVVLFDSWSARNISLYGYGRRTTPNIERLAERAIVYRHHYATGNFTTTGIASRLTGTYPWTHGATMPWGKIAAEFKRQSLFSTFDDYYRIAYTQNDLAYAVIKQFATPIQILPEVEDLYLEAPPAWLRHLFAGDKDIASVAWSRTVASDAPLTGYSLIAPLARAAAGSNPELERLRPDFPRGFPNRGDNTTAFTIETAVDWLLSQVETAPQPFLTYFHLMPPHSPYNSKVPFVDAFMDDGFETVPKPHDPLAEPEITAFREGRRLYDEFILYVDAQFANLYQRLEAGGHLENTWLILTSDHGESFDRGLNGHRTPSLYEPEISVPLLIFEPGRTAGIEVQDPTSAVDLLPTLAHLTDHPVPAWTEGVVLPPFAAPDSRRAGGIYSFVDRRDLGPLNWTASNIRWPYKLMYFNGYSKLAQLRTVNAANVKLLETLGKKNTLLRLFDLQADPEELKDLAVEQPEIVQAMLPELEGALGSFMPPN